jgi:hypothetical protein
MNPAELFRQESNTVQLAPGDFLFREGEKGDKMYVFWKGKSIYSLVILCSRQPVQVRFLARWR